MVDSKGLVTTSRGDDLPSHKQVRLAVQLPPMALLLCLYARADAARHYRHAVQPAHVHASPATLACLECSWANHAHCCIKSLGLISSAYSSVTHHDGANTV